jgi:hypothetical protein
MTCGRILNVDPNVDTASPAWCALCYSKASTSSEDGRRRKILGGTQETRQTRPLFCGTKEKVRKKQKKEDHEKGEKEN